MKVAAPHKFSAWKDKNWKSPLTDEETALLLLAGYPAPHRCGYIREGYANISPKKECNHVGRGSKINNGMQGRVCVCCLPNLYRLTVPVKDAIYDCRGRLIDDVFKPAL